LAPVELKKKFGFIDKKGKIVILPHFRNARDFSEGLAAVQEEGGYMKKYGYINKSGKMVIDYKFSYADSFSDGMACVQIKDKWGFIKNPLLK
jgi:hypothetical protein